MNTQVEVLNLSAFLQRNADGSSFVSCSGVIEGQPVEFTCDEESIVPVSTGTLFPVRDNPNRFGVQIKRTAALVLVGAQEIPPKEGEAPFEVNGVPVKHIRYSRVDYITREIPKVAWTVAAARKPAQQAPASGADTGAVA